MFTGRKKKNLSMNVNSWVDSKKIFEDQANILSEMIVKNSKKTTKIQIYHYIQDRILL